MPLKPCTEALGALTSTRTKGCLRPRRAGRFRLIAEINIWGEKIIIIIKKSGLLIISLLVCSAFRRNPNFLFTQKPRFLLFGEDFASVPISPGVLASAGARHPARRGRGGGGGSPGLGSAGFGLLESPVGKKLSYLGRKDRTPPTQLRQVPGRLFQG